MSFVYSQNSHWYCALSLTERKASLRAAGITPNGKAATDLAERRLQRWRSQVPFPTGSWFAQRLALDEINEPELLHLLGEPIQAVCSRYPVPPVWLNELLAAYSHPSSEPISLPEGLRSQVWGGFLDTIAPLLNNGCHRLRQGVLALAQSYTLLPFDPETVEGLMFSNLLPRLLMMLSRTLTLELHVARLEGHLQGATAEERLQSFLQSLRQRSTALAILREYPVLARQCMLAIAQWVAASLEFLQRLCEDWQALRTTFCPADDTGALVEVTGGISDNHRDGRSVLLAKFHSGLRLVYKPRSVAADVHFQELLAWLNDRGANPQFKTLQVVDRGSYGWAEFAAKQSCHSVTEVERFYQRQGGYLALLYALSATDFHLENLIAAGEHPVLIDLETLFQPRMRATDLQQAHEVAHRTLHDSALAVGLLPFLAWSNADSPGIDLSGLGGVANQLSPHREPRWEGVGTDKMRLIRKRLPLEGAQNRPSLNDSEVDVLAYTNALVEGFSGIYNLLRKHRNEFLSDQGPVASFAHDEVRVILRPTHTYAVLLHESFHPDVLRNALDRERLFDRLWGPVEMQPWLAKVIPAEREDLQNGDIPLFTTRSSSRDLWSTSRGRILDFFDEPGLTLVKRRVQRLSDGDLMRQLWIIRATLTTMSTGTRQAPHRTYRPTKPRAMANRRRLLAAARAAGDRLEALALHGKEDTSWIGLTITKDSHWSLAPLEIDLYDGLPGVALFLAYLGSVTCEERYNLLSRTTLIALRRQIEHEQSLLTTIGGFSGWGGVIYTMTVLAVLWNEPTLLTEAEAIVSRLLNLIEHDEQLDIIGGAAGCIGALLCLYRYAPSPRTLAAAVECGNRLIACAQPMEHGIGWVIQNIGPRPLAGFSHGAAGIAWALLELAAVTNEERFRMAACAAIDYERSMFSAKAGNWADLRNRKTTHQLEKDGSDRTMVAWCHGAPGIGLARLSSLPHLDDAATRREIDIALKTTLARGFGRNHSLCHGDLGNLELLLQASQRLDDPQWHAQVNRLVSLILDSMERDGWLCGNPLKVESPGLMTGLAGIGYELLRLAEPEQVPSVLTLAPPVPAGSDSMVFRLNNSQKYEDWLEDKESRGVDGEKSGSS